MPTNEYVICNLCGLNDTTLLYSVPVSTPPHPEIYNLVQCKNCGLVYLNPRPIKTEIHTYYPRTYYGRHDSSAKTIPARDRVRSILMEFAGGYRKSNTYLNWLITLAIKHLLMRIVPRKEKGKLLDIGCGNGSFLKWLKEHGWHAYGLEINKEAVNLCKANGIEVFEGELIEVHFANENFDVITLIQVLEHVHNPSAILNEVHRILKTDGSLLIAVPNFGCLDRKIFGADWPHLDIPRHLYHFELSTLKRLLEKNRFEIKEIRVKSFSLFGMRNVKSFLKCTIINLIKLLYSLFFLKLVMPTFHKNRKEHFGVFFCLYCSKLVEKKS